MRVIVIGATGHVGTYLVPRLVEAGHEVVALSRGQREPYLPHPAWAGVQRISCNRAAEEEQGSFRKRVADLRPDAVVDMICFDPESARPLVETLRGRVRHFLVCGTIWVHGPSERVPTTEDQPRRPFGDYGVKKAALEAYLLDEARRHGFPATVIHPGHIVGPGHPPVNPAGNRNPDVFARLARGEELALPNLGLETLHHVHADDVAQAFVRALESWGAAVGESFHAVSPQALTLRGFAEAAAGWFGKTARLAFLPWDEWKQDVPREDAEQTWDHIAHSPNCSIDKARRRIGYAPRYTSLEAVRESVEWLLDHGVLARPSH